MALDVIGSGFGRTGTASLKIALERLGFGPCHHMHEVLGNPPQVPHWQAIAAGRPVEWDEVFAGYRSQVDWPGAHAWRELAARYPRAKVIHSVRPEDAWWRSFSTTIARVFLNSRALPPLPPHVFQMIDATVEMVQAQTFGCPADDRDGVLAAYRRREAEVRATLAPDRLLVFDVAEGWEPLCRFLGVAVPDEPFPKVNSSAEFWGPLGGSPV
jgi:hypothetical protein